MKLIISARFVGLIPSLLDGGERRGGKKTVALQRANTILEAKQCFQQMNAYEFIQLVSGSDANSKPRRSDHPSLEGPVLNAPRAH